MAAIDLITATVTNAPVADMIQKLGLSIAQAQRALDENSIAMLAELGEESITIGDTETNLLALGFVPSFYAFTEASFEAKMDFSMAESEEFKIGGSLSAEFPISGVGMMAVNVNGHYARKFEQSASGSSSIAARMVSLPPPDTLLQLLKSMNPATPVTPAP